MSRVGDKIKGLFRWVAVGTVDATDLPMLIDGSAGDVTRPEVEAVNGFGFKAVPKAADATGEPLALMAGSGADAVAVAVVDFRYEPDDVTAGNSCMYNATGQRADMKPTGLEVNAPVKATGYKTTSGTGKTGALTITISAPATTGSVVLQLSGGIVTSVTAIGACAWVGD